MKGFCNIVIAGNLTGDPDLKTLPSGTVVTNFSVAVNMYRKGAGDNDSITTFYRCQMFGARGEVIAKNFKKGDPILLNGRDLSEREWTDKDGNKRTSLELVVDNFAFVGAKGDSNSALAEPTSNKSATAKDTAPTEIDEEIDLSEIPF
ncbi:MAG: single-stranded DNA-binding protein [Candidatus Nomurabacteria bacterium]|jgi:single-strand DNA-binding protein|nr:single-stranded DNA-binding protein [Candidatus Nomurabacteria bacterium]